jgi:hypothetical protein
MKLVSFFHVNHDIRTRSKVAISLKAQIIKSPSFASKRNLSRSSSGVFSPQNASQSTPSLVFKEKPLVPPTIGRKHLSIFISHCHSSLIDLFYFVNAPTLCYQTQYPRTSYISWTFVMRRVIEIVFCVALMMFMAEQYVKPATYNALVHIDQGNILQILERVTKLAIPNTCIWLLVSV